MMTIVCLADGKNRTVTIAIGVAGLMVMRRRRMMMRNIVDVVRILSNIIRFDWGRVITLFIKTVFIACTLKTLLRLNCGCRVAAGVLATAVIDSRIWDFIGGGHWQFI